MSDVKTEIRVNQEFSGVRAVQDFCIVHTSFEFARYIVTEDYAVTGGVVAPSNQPTLLTFTSVTSSSYTVSWTASVGGADVYLAIRRTSASPTYVPVDGTNYNVGDTVGDGEVRHFGAGVTFNESGLTFSTTYYYDIYAGNGATGTWVYLTTSPLEGSQATLFSFENAFSLDGINDGLSRPSVTTFSGLNKLDIAVWFYIDPTAATNQILVAWLIPSGTFNDGWFVNAVYQSAGVFKLRFGMYPSNNVIVTYGETGNLSLTGGWHFVVAKFDGTKSTNATRCIIKYDDVAQSLAFSGTIPTALGSDTLTLTVGRNSYGTAFTKGKLDHIAIKHGTWSDAEDTAHFNNYLGAEYASYNSHWNANSNTTDLGANALDLTLENGATYAAH